MKCVIILIIINHALFENRIFIVRCIDSCVVNAFEIEIVPKKKWIIIFNKKSNDVQFVHFKSATFATFKSQFMVKYSLKRPS